MSQHVSQLLRQDGLLPEQMRRRSAALDRARSILEGAGYLPMETPTLYFADTLLDQGGNEEFAYILRDSSDRSIIMPYDLTLPLARYVAMHSDKLPSPFKRYQIQKIWRQNPYQKALINELYRCDVDVIGSTSLLCEAEILKLLITTLEKMGIVDFKIRLNFLPLLQQITESLNIEEKQQLQTQAPSSQIQKTEVWKLLQPEETNTKTLQKLQSFDTTQIQQLLNFCSTIGISSNLLEFTPHLTRSGWQYYSGAIFEVVSIAKQQVFCEGGRYENLGKNVGSQWHSGVGMTFDLDSIMNLLEQRKMPLSQFLPQTLVALHPKSGASTALQLYQLLQQEGVQAELFFDAKTIEEQLQYAKQKQIPFLVFQEEIEGDILVMRVSTGRKKNLPIHQISAYFLGFYETL